MLLTSLFCGAQVIDVNFYPVPEARKSNMRHRPVGLGVQGLADAFIKMRCAYKHTHLDMYAHTSTPLR